MGKMKDKYRSPVLSSHLERESNKCRMGMQRTSVCVCMSHEVLKIQREHLV